MQHINSNQFGGISFAMQLLLDTVSNHDPFYQQRTTSKNKNTRLCLTAAFAAFKAGDTSADATADVASFPAATYADRLDTHLLDGTWLFGADTSGILGWHLHLLSDGLLGLLGRHGGWIDGGLDR